MNINPTPIFVKLVELDLSRDEACARAKIGRDTLRKVEAGRLVNLKSLKRLCLSLGIKPQEVLVHAPAPTQTQGSEDLGDRRGSETNQHGHNAEGAR